MDDVTIYFILPIALIGGPLFVFTAIEWYKGYKAPKRDLFTELMEGFEDLADERAGKTTLRTTKASNN